MSVLESQYCHFVIRNRAAKNLLIDQWFMEYYIMKRPLWSFDKTLKIWRKNYVISLRDIKSINTYALKFIWLLFKVASWSLDLAGCFNIIEIYQWNSLSELRSILCNTKSQDKWGERKYIVRASPCSETAMRQSLCWG